MFKIRQFFMDKGFWEVETPLLVHSPCMEPHLDPFITYYSDPNGKTNTQLFLPTSPEFHMKRLLSMSAGDIFQITRAFRNGESGRLHEPEFTILEWYRSNAGYFRIMDDCEQLIKHLAKKVLRELKIDSLRDFLSRILETSFERITVAEAWNQYTGIDIHSTRSAADLLAAGRCTSTPNLKEDDSWDVLYFKMFLHLIEPYLGINIPTILYEYPASMAALACCHPHHPDIALRFEMYIHGIEIANAFDELRDANEQRRRFVEASAVRRDCGKTPHPIDEKFLDALKKGIPPSSGIALGIDRLMMILMGARSIQEVTAFPFSRELENYLK